MGLLTCSTCRNHRVPGAKKAGDPEIEWRGRVTPSTIRIFRRQAGCRISPAYHDCAVVVDKLWAILWVGSVAPFDR